MRRGLDFFVGRLHSLLKMESNSKKGSKMIGVLALQGAFLEHVNALHKIKGVDVKQVKTEKDLIECDSLIIPGGESTAIALAAKRNDLFDKIVDFIKSGKPVWVCFIYSCLHSFGLRIWLVLESTGYHTLNYILLSK